jgi:hypothetical protein
MKSAYHQIIQFAALGLMLSSCAPRFTLNPAAGISSGEVAADSRHLSQLERTFVRSQNRGEESMEGFVLASRRLAEERGIEIIHAVMSRAKNWKGEEGIVFAPLIEFLPRRPPLQLLRNYQQSRHTSAAEALGRRVHHRI